MKLTKTMVDILKFRGAITMTAPSEKFVERFETLEALLKSGFVNPSKYKTISKEDLNFIEGNVTPEPVNAPVVEPEVIQPEVVAPSEIEVPVEDVPVEEAPKPKKTTRKSTKKTTKTEEEA